MSKLKQLVGTPVKHAVEEKGQQQQQQQQQQHPSSSSSPGNRSCGGHMMHMCWSYDKSNNYDIITWLVSLFFLQILQM